MQSLAIPQHPVETTDKDFDSLGLSQSILRCVRLVGFETSDAHPGRRHPGSAQRARPDRPRRDRLRQDGGLLASRSAERLAPGPQGPRPDRLPHPRDRPPDPGFPRRLRRRLQPADGLPDRRRQDGAAAYRGSPPPPRHRGNPRPPARPRRAAAPRGSTDFNLLVLDEADHMLDMGFMPQVNRILQELPQERQTLMFSATMPPPIERSRQQFMIDPVRIDITPRGQAAHGISHRLYLVEPDEQEGLPARPAPPGAGQHPGLHPPQERRRVALPAARCARGIRSSASTPTSPRGSGPRRSRASARASTASWWRPTSPPAASTSPASRHIINFDMPETVEDYIHRAGRTARGNATGIVSTIATWIDKPTDQGDRVRRSAKISPAAPSPAYSPTSK